MAGIDTLFSLLAGAKPMAQAAAPISGGNAMPGGGTPSPVLAAALQALLSKTPMGEQDVALSGGGPRIPGVEAEPASFVPRITNNTAGNLDSDFDESGPGGPSLGFDRGKAGDFLTDVSAGFDRSQPGGLASFLSGVGAGRGSTAARAAGQRATMLEDEDRAIAAEDRTFDRSQKVASGRRAEAASARANRLADARIAEIERKAGGKGLTGADVLAIERLAVGDYARSLGLTTSGTMSAANREAALAKVDEYRGELQARLLAAIPGGDPAMFDDGVTDDPYDDFLDADEAVAGGGDRGPSAPAAPATAAPPGSAGAPPRAVNPQTGEAVIWNGTAWVPE